MIIIAISLLSLAALIALGFLYISISDAVTQYERRSQRVDMKLSPRALRQADKDVIDPANFHDPCEYVLLVKK